MKHFFYILFLIINISCYQNKTRSENKVDSTHNKYSIKEINKTSIISVEKINEFITELKKQPIEQLPFAMDSYLLKNNKDNSNYFEKITNLTNSKYDSTYILNNKKLTFNKKDSIEVLDIFTKQYLKSYYYLLTKDCQLTPYIFYKRLTPINNNFEVFINYCKIKSKESTNGIIMKLNFLDLESKVTHSYYIKIAGIGVNSENDPGYYEDFQINKDYLVNINSYTGTEDESIEISRKLIIDKDGSFIKEIVFGKTTSTENGETYIENFSKEIKH